MVPSSSSSSSSIQGWKRPRNKKCTHTSRTAPPTDLSHDRFQDFVERQRHRCASRRLARPFGHSHLEWNRVECLLRCAWLSPRVAGVGRAVGTRGAVHQRHGDETSCRSCPRVCGRFFHHYRPLQKSCTNHKTRPSTNHNNKCHRRDGKENCRLARFHGRRPRTPAARVVYGRGNSSPIVYQQRGVYQTTVLLCGRCPPHPTRRRVRSDGPRSIFRLRDPGRRTECRLGHMGGGLRRGLGTRTRRSRVGDITAQYASSVCRQCCRTSLGHDRE